MCQIIEAAFPKQFVEVINFCLCPLLVGNHANVPILSFAKSLLKYLMLVGGPFKGLKVRSHRDQTKAAIDRRKFILVCYDLLMIM